MMIHVATENVTAPVDSQLALATAITQAMSQTVSQSLQPLLASKAFKNKHNKYKGERDGVVYTCLTITERYLEETHKNDSPADRTWTFIEFLVSEARN